MKAILRLITLLVLATATTLCLAQYKPTFVFVKINEALMPIDRGSKYEDPLDSALKKANLGEVTGGGSSLSKDRKIQWVGVDVELINLEKGIPFLKQKLIEFGVPKGSTLEYQVQGEKIQVPIHAETN